VGGAPPPPLDSAPQGSFLGHFWPQKEASGTPFLGVPWATEDPVKLVLAPGQDVHQRPIRPSETSERSESGRETRLNAVENLVVMSYP